MDYHCTQYFSHDLFHSYIIPDLVSDFIHNLLINSSAPTWNPFLTLPLVSRDFYVSCHTLCIGIFGPFSEMNYDDEMTPNGIMAEILHGVQESWYIANGRPSRAQPLDPMTQEDLKCTESLLQVYVCVATAKSYLNLDVLWHLELEQRRIAGEFDDAELDDEDMDLLIDEDIDMDDDGDGDGDMHSPITAPVRRFKMRDDTMHRVFLPLTCAIELCDQIRPARLADIVASYIADIIPLYSTAPLLLKYTQDLEMYVTGDHRFGMRLPQENNLFFIQQTLGLVDQTSRLLQEMQEDTGKLVRSFKRSSLIPKQVLHETKILQALDKVATNDWGEGTGWINKYTNDVHDNLMSAAGLQNEHWPVHSA